MPVDIRRSMVWLLRLLVLVIVLDFVIASGLFAAWAYNSYVSPTSEQCERVFYDNFGSK